MHFKVSYINYKIMFGDFHQCMHVLDLVMTEMRFQMIKNKISNERNTGSGHCCQNV